jgi:hypothetical protein
MRSRILIATTCLILAIVVPASAQQTAATPAPVREVKFEKYYRTELYMGMSIPGGAMVSDSDWEKFLSDFVTPLFPDGFSVLAGRGQYREATGTIAKEPSHVLVFLYQRAKRKDAGAKIESIRNEYRKRFSQESVLRVDITKSVSVSF